MKSSEAREQLLLDSRTRRATASTRWCHDYDLRATTATYEMSPDGDPLVPRTETLPQLTRANAHLRASIRSQGLALPSGIAGGNRTYAGGEETHKGESN